MKLFNRKSVLSWMVLVVLLGQTSLNFCNSDSAIPRLEKSSPSSDIGFGLVFFVMLTAIGGGIAPGLGRSFYVGSGVGAACGMSVLALEVKKRVEERSQRQG